MAKKTTAKPETTTAKPETVVRGGKARRSHKAADLAPAHVELPEGTLPDGAVDANTPPGAPAQTVELDDEQGGLTPDEQNAESGEDELMGNDAEEAAPESGSKPSAPATGGAKFAWLARVNAQRALDHAIAQLSKHDYTQWPEVGVHGVSGAIAILKNASASMEKLNKKSKPTRAAGFEVGTTVRLRAKVAAKYDGIIEAAETFKITSLDKRAARGVLANGDKVAVPVGDLEVAS
jgi:hypothetical protein